LRTIDIDTSIGPLPNHLKRNKKSKHKQSEFDMKNGQNNSYQKACLITQSKIQDTTKWMMWKIVFSTHWNWFGDFNLQHNCWGDGFIRPKMKTIKEVISDTKWTTIITKLNRSTLCRRHNEDDIPTVTVTVINKKTLAKSSTPTKNKHKLVRGDI
jgi:hypothetical protein